MSFVSYKVKRLYKDFALINQQLEITIIRNSDKSVLNHFFVSYDFCKMFNIDMLKFD